MAIRLYLDEDSVHHGLIRALRARSMDVTSALEEGMIGRDDSAQLIHATETGRVLYTYNVGDFHRLHREFLATGRVHAGLVLVPQQRYSIGEQLRRILRLNKARTTSQMRNRMEFLGNWG